MCSGHPKIYIESFLGVVLLLSGGVLQLVLKDDVSDVVVRFLITHLYIYAENLTQRFLMTYPVRVI